MAPSAEEWQALSPAERAAVVETLPAEVTYGEMAPPEGDRHFNDKTRALDARLKELLDRKTHRREKAEQEIARLRAEFARRER
jgi:hypothetical protein